jgi:hypothetical protein
VRIGGKKFISRLKVKKFKSERVKKLSPLASENIKLN